ncbi:MAG: hypothetical protein M3137_14115 [Actinomycetota bacterium]|nr:hypothetical protein [Actinomycetota bacterium]
MDGAGEQDDIDDDQAVLRYIEAVQATHSGGPPFWHGDAAAERLAASPELNPTDDHDLARQLAERTPGSVAEVRRLEGRFVDAARGYSLRHRVTYEGWLQAGVSAAVLERAGISAGS